MSVVLLTDTHWGVRGDRELFHEYTKKFLDEKFFPYLDEHVDEIEAVVHLGDLVDRRKYINFSTMNRLKNDFLDPLAMWAEGNLKVCYFIVGNHDCYYRDTNEINSLTEILNHNRFIPVVSDIEDIPHGITLVPWICSENRERIHAQIKESEAKIALGHFELKGYEMYNGVIASHGDEPSFLHNFQMVCSGHYHKRTSDGWMNYIGSTSQFTWSDCGDDRGFAVLDPTTFNLTYVNTDDKLFHKVWYDDSKPVHIPHGLSEKFVKVIVAEKNNPKLFEQFIDAIQLQNPAELQIIEGTTREIGTAKETNLEAGTAIDIFKDIIAESNLRVDKAELLKVLHDLYVEASQTG